MPDRAPTQADPSRPAVVVTPRARTGGQAQGAAGTEHALTCFFLRGHPRSGTNWVSRLLNLHPRIHCTGEWHLSTLLGAVDSITTRPFMVSARPPYKRIIRDGFRGIVRDCLRASADDRPQVTHVGDRTPAPLGEVFEGDKHILVLRDGRDVLVSFTYHNLSGKGVQLREGPLARAMKPALDRFKADPTYFTHHPAELLACEAWVRFAASRWAQRARRDRATTQRLNGSDAEQGPRVHTVRYEALHADVGAQLASMLRFLGLDPTQAAPVGSAEGTAPGGGVTTEDPNAYRRKGVSGDWQKYFTPDVTRWFKDEAGQALIDLGYESSEAWTLVRTADPPTN